MKGHRQISIEQVEDEHEIPVDSIMRDDVITGGNTESSRRWQVNVLLNKTVEQACLEVEEEHELEAIRKFKFEYHKRRQIEDSEWHEDKVQTRRQKRC